VASLEGLDRLTDPIAERPILAEHKAPDRYFQALRVGDDKLIRVFAPPRRSGGDSLPVAPGTRWEAEFAVVGEAMRVSQLKPREEETDDPPELKGPIEALGDGEFRIAGVRVRYDSATRLQTEEGTAGPELADALVVKARGPVSDGVMQAERIKFYPPDESAQLELRATVQGVHEEGKEAWIRMAGFELQVTADTDLKGAERGSGKRKLTREEIAELVDAGAGHEAAGRCFDVRRTRFDLARDPAERAGTEEEGGSPLDTALDELGQRLAARRVFGAGDRKALDDQAMRELQDIGYGGDDH
jgi:hypothetical protein